MTLPFESEQDVIVFALEKIIRFSQANQYIFVAQCVWWIAWALGLQQGLTIHIDNLRERELRNLARAVSPVPRDLTEDQRLDIVLEETEAFLQESERTRNTLPTENRIYGSTH
jgi:hypothetical protein